MFDIESDIKKYETDLKEAVDELQKLIKDDPILKEFVENALDFRYSSNTERMVLGVFIRSAINIIDNQRTIDEEYGTIYNIKTLINFISLYFIDPYISDIGEFTTTYYIDFRSGHFVGYNKVGFQTSKDKIYRGPEHFMNVCKKAYEWWNNENWQEQQNKELLNPNVKEIEGEIRYRKKFIFEIKDDDDFEELKEYVFLKDFVKDLSYYPDNRCIPSLLIDKNEHLSLNFDILPTKSYPENSWRDVSHETD